MSDSSDLVSSQLTTESRNALGFAIVTLVLGNVFAATGWGKWFPYAIVPLHTGIAGPRVSVLEPGSYVVLLLLFAAGIAATVGQVRSADETQ